MRKIERIIVHCTAGSQRQTVGELVREFRRRGWHNPGYHYVVTADGVVHTLLEEAGIGNGVKGYNATAIHVAYTGGIDAGGHPVDNRTEAQRRALSGLLADLHRRYPDAVITGHRDLSPDTNGNGVVDPWERVKECPCFDASKEYAGI